MKARRRHLAALGACAVVLVAPGCGSSDDPEGEPLPADAVASIEKRLDEVQRRYDAGTEDGNAGACQDIENDSYKAIDATVRALPQDVDPDIREALESSLARLKELTGEGCSDVKEEPVETETVPPEPVTPPPAPEQPAPEQTETQPAQPQEKPKDEEDGNGNNGQGNGNGSGGTQPGGTQDPGGGGGDQLVPPADGDD